MMSHLVLLHQPQLLTSVFINCGRRKMAVSQKALDNNNHFLYQFQQGKREEIWLSPITKAPTLTEKSTRQHKNATKNFDYTTIADRLGTVSWSSNSHPTGVV